MQRDGEDIPSVRSAHCRFSAQDSWPAGRQRLTDGARSSKDCSRAIAVVDVAINCHGGADFVVTLHAADCDRHIVNHAKTFAVVGKRMVESAANVYRDSIDERVLSREYRAARSQPECADQFGRERDFELEFLTG